MSTTERKLTMLRGLVGLQSRRMDRSVAAGLMRPTDAERDRAMLEEIVVDYARLGQIEALLAPRPRRR